MSDPSITSRSFVGVPWTFQSVFAYGGGAPFVLFTFPSLGLEYTAPVFFIGFNAHPSRPDLLYLGHDTWGQLCVSWAACTTLPGPFASRNAFIQALLLAL